MSQAIQVYTPLPPSYQGNLQQQASAALASSSSSSMPGDSISPIAIGLGVTAGGLLTAVAATLAVKHFSTSGDKPKPAQATSLTSKPVRRTQTLHSPSEFAPASNEEIPPPQRKLMWATCEEMPPPQHTQQSQYITLPGFPGFIDRLDGVYRERQIGGLCVMHSLNTVLYRFFKAKKLITREEFEKIVPKALSDGAHIRYLVGFAKKNGLSTEIIVKRTGGEIITDIGDTDAFIISDDFHSVAMVRSEITGRFHISDSGDQDKAKSEIYSDIANEAFKECQRKHNIIARDVTTFHKCTSAQGPELIDEKFLWNEKIKGHEKEPGGKVVYIR